MRTETVIVISGGPVVPVPTLKLPDAARVVAADRGVDHALEAGLEVDVAVGDFDSISAAALATLEARNVRTLRYQPDKDATDLELALDEAAALGPQRLLVVSGTHGRLDHLLAELLLLGSERYASFEIDALLGPTTVHVVRGDRTLEGRRDETISLLALHGPAEGITTTGLVYPLDGETLTPGSTRGMSNVFAASQARITIQRGALLALRPNPEGELR